MLPIYSDLLKMWSDLGYNLPITEGKYWLENNFIQGFARDGTLIKLWKYKVFDDLHIEITPYHNKTKYLESDLETWQETVERNSERMLALENESIELIKRLLNSYTNYDRYILTSTGKDSMVTLDLVHKVDPNIPVVFNNTSLDCADTYRMVKAHKEWVINNPPEGFYHWIERYNFIPQRMSRSCCDVFKEGNGDNYFEKKNIQRLLMFMGVRNSESNARANREDLTHSPKWGDKQWYGCLPIRKWSEFDVWLYILKHNVEINPKYKKGYSRCGCAIACPFATKYTWVLDKYWYPKMREMGKHS